MLLRAATFALLVTTFFAPSLLRANDPDPSKLLPTAEQAARASELVGKLGDPIFKIRNDATRELRKLGRAALPVLNVTLNTTTDPEVRNRCETLLPAIELDDLNARLAAFLADTAHKYDHKIRSWDEFKAITGDTKVARELFAEALRSTPNRELIQAMSLNNKADLERLVLARRMLLYNNIYRNTTGRVTAKPVDVFSLLFVESHVEISDRRYQYVIQNLLSQAVIRNSLNGDDGEPHRKLLAHWMDSRTQYLEVYQAMTLAGQLNMKEIPVSRYALKVLENQSSPTVYRMYALTTSARTLGEESLSVLKKGMDDKSVHTVTWFFNGQRTQHSVQVRDIALAMSLIVTKQDLDDYGIEQRNRTTGTTISEASRYNYMYYAFKDDKARTAAFKKFSEWEKAQAEKKAEKKAEKDDPSKPKTNPFKKP